MAFKGKLFCSRRGGLALYIQPEHKSERPALSIDNRSKRLFVDSLKYTRVIHSRKIYFENWQLKENDI